MTKLSPESLTRKTTHLGIEAYHAWLEMGAILLDVAHDDPGQKANRKKSLSYVKMGKELTESFDKQAGMDVGFIIKHAKHKRAKTIFISRFPEVIDMFGKDQRDYITESVTRQSLRLAGVTQNPFVEQIGCEQSLLRLNSQRWLHGCADAYDYAIAQDKILDLSRYWQPRALAIWSRSDEAKELIDSDKLTRIDRIIHPTVALPETGSPHREATVPEIVVAMNAVRSPGVHQAPLPRSDGQLLPGSAADELAG